MNLLKFKLEISKALVESPSSHRSIKEEEDGINLVSPSIKKSKYYNLPTKKPSHDKRYDMYEHFPCVDDISRTRKCMFENCENNSKTRYGKCNVYLCL
ncbi:uncharacterized protein NPIL_691581 [Nephila pilipes]|uniref:Uncharacterized protein n=1 Tax=Nephila pilipes TaxID=299642 RepID=A0A8X6N9V1_NEPPI|nr:uncharacterized protein NPIL_691581 [Nephila pilipes]